MTTKGRMSPLALYALSSFVALAAIAGYLFGVHHFFAPDHRRRALDSAKVAIAALAAVLVLYERRRARQARPVAERWKRLVGIALAVAAVASYSEGLDFTYPRFYHRWDQYHYYLGAKYFPEMGYDGLYRCAAVAEDDLGVVVYENEDQIGTGSRSVDLKAEVRDPTWKIRSLGVDNSEIPVTEILAHPEACKSRFTPERWDAYKADVRFFRLACGTEFWRDMQTDHGYNPPPVWTVAGHFIANLHPATTRYLQLLASIDLVLFAGMFTALWWAFGWRVSVVAAIFLGTQAIADSDWTQGAFLRQDWLFLLVLSACLTRKRWYAAAGAALTYATLLRVFPGLTAIGWLVVAGAYLFEHRTLSRPQWRMLAGGALAAAVLVPCSLQVCGRDAYRDFARHIAIHDNTPLTNHMGLRVLVSEMPPVEIPALGIGVGPESGRVKYVKDPKLADSFSVFKAMRNARYAKYKPVAYGVVALSLAFFALVVRRIKSLWIAQCLALVFILLMSQLTNYYYSFLILLAPLTLASRRLEVPLFAFAALTGLTNLLVPKLDDKYWMLTALSLAFSFGAIGMFRRRGPSRPLARPGAAAQP